MDLQKERYLGYEFVKFGSAEWCETGIEARHDGKFFQWHAALDTISPDFLSAEQSVYIVKVGTEVKYIGVYSDTFKSRWLKKGRYLWHSENLDNKINQLIKKGVEVTFWLSVDPYVSTSDAEELNISQALEYELIRKLSPEWNTTHKDKSLSKMRLRVKDIVARIE